MLNALITIKNNEGCRSWNIYKTTMEFVYSQMKCKYLYYFISTWLISGGWEYYSYNYTHVPSDMKEYQRVGLISLPPFWLWLIFFTLTTDKIFTLNQICVSKICCYYHRNENYAKKRSYLLNIVLLVFPFVITLISFLFF